ncbi:MAG: T9SS type A sorting domain-containing protein [Saprospiraceae bacterium]|nr:T9SS type A sorting domain-containing protein [Saprospiraceae bacterium]
MKSLYYSFFLILPFWFGTDLSAQETRYFQFRAFCGGDDWRDTSFVASATNADLINAVLAEIERPFEERKFIIGDITEGDGGFNFNAEFRFNWHFVPDQWQLAEVAVEVCDGCPYTNVHRDSNLWLNNVGFFCPWTSKPVQEITLTNLEELKQTQAPAITVFPNPSRNQVFIKHQLKGPVRLELLNMANSRLRFYPSWENGVLSVAGYPAGIYTLLIRSEGELYAKRLVIQN